MRPILFLLVSNDPNLLRRGKGGVHDSAAHQLLAPLENSEQPPLRTSSRITENTPT